MKGYNFESFPKLMLLFLIKFIGVTLAHKTIQVSKFDTSYVIFSCLFTKSSDIYMYHISWSFMVSDLKLSINFQKVNGVGYIS